MITPNLTAAELAALIENREDIPDRLLAAVAKTVSDNKPLDSALAVQRYIDLGHGRHEEAGGAYYLAGEDVCLAPSTVRDHYKRFRHLLESYGESTLTQFNQNDRESTNEQSITQSSRRNRTGT